MHREQRKKVVCFDLGGVLVRICRTWDEACAAAALPLRGQHQSASASWHRQRQQLSDLYQRGQLDCDGYYRALSASLDAAYSLEELERIHRAWSLAEYPGSSELVHALNARGDVLTACLSNTNHAHWQRLTGADGRAEYSCVPLLGQRLASHLLGCAKPDPRIYALAHASFASAQPVGAEDIVFFDDLPANVDAARAAGWSAFLVDHQGDTVQQMRRELASLDIQV
jgi:putative hydrolase of the HAD superfamily